MVRYKAMLVAPDGRYVIDYYGKTVDEVEKKLSERGSQWLFYPFEFIIRDRTRINMNQKIIAAPEPFDVLAGSTVRTALDFCTFIGCMDEKELGTFMWLMKKGMKAVLKQNPHEHRIGFMRVIDKVVLHLLMQLGDDENGIADGNGEVKSI